MTNISNRGLVLLILMTLALSVFTTLFSHSQMSRLNEQLTTIQTPTGFATASQSGTASINLTSDVAFNLNVASLDWGYGIINQTNPSCATVTLSTNGTTNATLNPNNCWTSDSSGTGAIVEQDDFILENTGTSTLLVRINGTNSTNFLGWGSAATTGYDWRAFNNEAGSCTGTLTNAWTSFDDETTYSNVCTVLEYDNNNDELLIEINFTFQRSEVVPGARTATVHFLVENAT